MNNLGSSINRNKLADNLRLRLSQNEVKDLSFQMKVDYEELSGETKDAKILEFVIYLERRDRLDELVTLLSERYPHAVLNLQQVLESAVESDERTRSNVQKLMGTFRIYYETLYEWKELHNHLDEISNIFSQYSAQVERFAIRVEPVDVEILKISWRPVNIRISLLLTWASEDINLIGERYQLLPGGDQIGVEWAIEFQQLSRAVDQHLVDIPAQGNSLTSRSGKLGGVLGVLSGNKEQDDVWQIWWCSLTEVTRQLDDALRRHMFLTDKELRKTASDLYDLSKEALWS